MNIKTYSLPDNSVSYFYSLFAKKWEFKIHPIDYTFLTRCPGRAEVAEKVARILSGAVKRSGHVDGLARANIKKLVGNI